MKGAETEQSLAEIEVPNLADRRVTVPQPAVEPVGRREEP